MSREAVGAASSGRFDSADVPAADRAHVVAALLARSVGGARVVHLCDKRAVWARLRSTRFTPSTAVCRLESSAVHLTRRACDVATTPDRRALVALPGGDGGTLWQDGRVRHLAPGVLVLVDGGSPWDYRGGAGELCLVHLDLPAPLGPASGPTELATSPLHDLARDQVRALAAVELPPTTSAAVRQDVGRAAALTLTTLLISCRGGASFARSVPAGGDEVTT